ncbi:MAG: DUF1080 domain-containing protein [Verrucomicrobiae bacterium]|nr:DUF1080 domain-containing protein [Verrucomicrobiae bacterium]
MKRRLNFGMLLGGSAGLALIVVAMALSGCRQVRPDSSSNHSFRPLFDGHSLTGWVMDNPEEPSYGVTNGSIYCRPGGKGKLFTEKEYENFILRFEFKLDSGANNGIGIRAPLRGHTATLGMEIQILDETAAKEGRWGQLRPEQYHGSIYDVAAAEKGALKPVGEWNSEQITADGRKITVIVNGITILDVNLNEIDDPAKIARHPGLFRECGHIGLLGHGDYVEFRNFQIQELPRKTERKDFVSLFNGQDLTGWKGSVGAPPKRAALSPADLAAVQTRANEQARANWKVEAGALVYRGTNTDNLSTDKDYVNFELVADWKIEPEGNSGVYLRGTPQVEICDPFTHAAGGSEGGGSGGLINNRTNANQPLLLADKPLGEWNRFRIIMVADKVHVFLNDQLVVNGATLENVWQRDLSVLPFGPIELEARRTPVWFKNLYLRELSPPKSWSVLGALGGAGAAQLPGDE